MEEKWVGVVKSSRGPGGRGGHEDQSLCNHSRMGGRGEPPAEPSCGCGWVQAGAVGAGRSWHEEPADQLCGTDLLSPWPGGTGPAGSLPGQGSRILGGLSASAQPPTLQARILLPGTSPYSCLELAVVCGIANEEVPFVPSPSRLCCLPLFGPGDRQAVQGRVSGSLAGWNRLEALCLHLCRPSRSLS